MLYALRAAITLKVIWLAVRLYPKKDTQSVATHFASLIQAIIDDLKRKYPEAAKVVKN